MALRRLDIKTSAEILETAPHEEEREPISDKDLLSHLKSDSVDAFEEIFRRYFEVLTDLGALSLRLDVAEDISQEVLIDLWNRRAEIEVKQGLRVYLLGAARKKVLYYLRKERTSVRVSHTLQELDYTPALLESPEDFLEGGEFKELFHRYLRKLNPMQREIVLLRWNQGMTFKEISVILDITENAVLKHMGRIRTILKPFLERLLR